MRPNEGVDLGEPHPALQLLLGHGKRLALIEAAREVMVAGSGGDDTANAVEAWRRGLADVDGTDPDPTPEGH